MYIYININSNIKIYNHKVCYIYFSNELNALAASELIKGCHLNP
jgi:hypothetical protein